MKINIFNSTIRNKIFSMTILIIIPTFKKEQLANNIYSHLAILFKNVYKNI